MRKLFTLMGGLVVTTSMLFSPVQASDSDNDKTMDYGDIFQLEYAASPRISPDGGSVIYERRSMDVMRDRMRTNIWQVDLDGTNHRPLLSGKANFRMPRFSKDGGRLAYISSVEGKNQLYVRWMESGRTARVTDLQRGPGNLSWSPDGKWLAFTMFVPAKSKSLFKEMPSKPKGAKWAGKAKYIDRTSYRSNSAGFLPRGFTHIFLVPTDGGTPRQITKGNFHHGGSINWTSDSGKVIFSADRNDDWEYRPIESDIYQLDLSDDSLVMLTDRKGPDTSPLLSPDGSKIAYLRFEDRELSSQNMHLYVMDSDGSNPVDLTPDLDRGVSNLQWSQDGNGVYFSYDDQGKNHTGYVNLSGNRRVITANVGGQSLGRPYTSGDYRAVGDGRLGDVPVKLTSVGRGERRRGK